MLLNNNPQSYSGFRVDEALRRIHYYEEHMQNNYNSPEEQYDEQGFLKNKKNFF